MGRKRVLPKGVRRKGGTYEARATINKIPIYAYGKDLDLLLKEFEYKKEQARNRVDYRKNGITSVQMPAFLLCAQVGKKRITISIFMGFPWSGEREAPIPITIKDIWNSRSKERISCRIPDVISIEAPFGKTGERISILPKPITHWKLKTIEWEQFLRPIQG